MRPEEETKAACQSTETMCVFMVTGHTFTFRGVYDVVDNENCISFRYRAMSDGKEKRGVFFKYNGSVAGISRF